MRIEQGAFSKKIYFGTKKISNPFIQLDKAVTLDQESAKIYTSQKANFVVGSIFGAGAGFCIGFGVTQALLWKKTSGWTVAGVGGGLLCVSIPFSVISSKKLKLTVLTYNKNSQM